MTDSRLSTKTKLGYGVCDLGGNLFFTVLAFLLMNYLTDTVGLSASLAGAAVMIGKVWDAVTDPMAGYLSDRTTHRWGRRRPWIFYGSFPLFVTMVVMFASPGFTSQPVLFVWATLAFCALCTAYTVVNIPYSALTPELTQNYHERTSLNGYRFAFAVVGTLLGAGAALPIVGLFPSKSTGYSAMGAIFGALMLITALVTFFAVKEPATQRPVASLGFFKTYSLVFRNRPFIIILLAYAVHIMGLTLVSSTIIYYYKYVHHNEALTTTAMLILLVTAMLFIPVSVALAKRVGKKGVYGAGLLVMAVSIMLIYFFGHRYSAGVSLGIMLLAGVGMGFTYALPYAIVPDAIEYDYLLTGERHEGAYYGIWTFGLKIGQAISTVIVGAVLSAVHYAPDVAQSSDSLLGIRLLIGPIPALTLLASATILYFYPISEARYKEICIKIKEMEDNRA